METINYDHNKFYDTGPLSQFHKIFWCNLCSYWCTAFSFDSGYNAWGVNYAEKVFALSSGQFH